MNVHESALPWTSDLRVRLDELLDEHRAMLHDSLDGLTEEEARRSLVPSRTTLLGLVKHVTGRGPRALWAIYAHMLRELAQHCGHADILREQVLAGRE
ncbi:DUF664 domain-containing protein [Actinopolymorpha sp. B9G3]|uniref:mycothiol transferase n=1 Tax=Actinopolymorpha sp. B9G3 TaxID=3158970 RepID=UPI0032D995B9